MLLEPISKNTTLTEKKKKETMPYDIIWDLFFLDATARLMALLLQNFSINVLKLHFTHLECKRNRSIHSLVRHYWLPVRKHQACEHWKNIEW